MAVGLGTAVGKVCGCGTAESYHRHYQVSSLERQARALRSLLADGSAGSGLLKRSRYYLIGLAVIPLLLALFAYFISARHIRSVAKTLATDRFLLQLDELLTTVQDAETGQRGYLLTGSQSYLAPYTRAREEMRQKLATAISLASQAGIRPGRLKELESAVWAKMAELELTLALYDSGQPSALAAEIGTNRGQREMAHIRELIGALKDEQTSAYESRYAQQLRSQRYLTAALGIVVAISILLLVFAFKFGTMYVLKRDMVEAEIRSLNEELELRVRERTSEIEARTRQLEAQTRELARSNADLNQFASIASHDLQEPLRMVGSYMGMLSRKYGHALDETAQTYIQFAIGGATRMQTLISDLLSYSRAGTQSVAKRPTPFENILKHAIENLQVAMRENAAVLRHGALPVVEIDEVKMTQVVQNLVGNAIKFRKPDVPPEITISAERRHAEWLFCFADNGIGFDARHSDRIFQVFQRLHGVGRYPGNGIGLSICKRIVEHHGGRLWAQSEPGAGSTFFFTLPNSSDGDARERIS